MKTWFIYYRSQTWKCVSVLACYVSDNCGVSAPHNFVEHVHEIHSRKPTTSSEHGVERKEEESESKGIFRA